jgi:methylated-DNA-[protein]-cysteine S-methyltransferase
MASFLAEIALASNGGVASLSRQYPDVNWDVRPFGFRWMLRGEGPPGAIARVRESVRLDRSYVRLGKDVDSTVSLAYAPKVGESTVLRHIAENGGFILPPITVKDGMIRVRFITNRKVIPPDGGRTLPAGELVSVRRLTAERLEAELDRQSADSLTLTPRQAEVLLEAVRTGYYEVPRRTTVLDIARRLSLGRSTAEEHLRIAESAIVRSAAPLIALSREVPTDDTVSDPVEHFVRFSSELQLYVDLALRGGRVAGVRFVRSAPAAHPGRGHPYLTQILQHIRTGTTELDEIPLELDVGEFEKKVLEEVRRIPSGETRTYAEIARRIGHPYAVRAVGNACAHNPAIVVIPCHRVVPARGGVGSYSAAGGTETKRRLLRREGALTDPTPRLRSAADDVRTSGSRPTRAPAHQRRPPRAEPTSSLP